MLGIVLPSVASSNIGAIAPADIGVAVEVVVVVDVHVAATPAASPSPAATSPERPHGNPNAKGERDTGGIVSRRWVVDRRVRIDRSSPNDLGIVGRDIHDLRARRFNYDHRLVVDGLGCNLLLLGRFQRALLLGLAAHPLHGIHHIAFLRQERVTQIRSPLDVVGEPLHDVGQSRQSLHAWIPRLLRDGVGKRFILQSRIFRQPLLQLDDFEGIGGCSQDLRQQRVRVKGNRRHQRIHLVGRNLRVLGLWRCRLLRPCAGSVRQRVPGGKQNRANDRHNASQGCTHMFNLFRGYVQVSCVIRRESRMKISENRQPRPS